MSRIVKCLKFYPAYNLTSSPIIASLMLAEDARLLVRDKGPYDSTADSHCQHPTAAPWLC